MIVIELLSNPQAWMALATLTLLEIVLGIDNIIFITILVGRLPLAQQARARLIGLSLAMFMRIGLLLSLTWVMGLTEPFFTVLDQPFSGRDLILLGGGLFLIFKSVTEVHHALEGAGAAKEQSLKQISFAAVITQIAIIDIIFSLDSVITAVGLAEHVEVMVVAIVIAVLVMMVAAKTIGEFVETHPTLKMLALSFLILIGTALMAEGLGFHVPKGYIYFSMAFAVLVEILNIRVRKASINPIKLTKTEV